MVYLGSHILSVVFTSGNNSGSLRLTLLSAVSSSAVLCSQQFQNSGQDAGFYRSWDRKYSED